MRLKLIAAGTRLPDWINAGCADYAARFAAPYQFSLKEIPVTARTRGVVVERARAEEGKRMLAAVGAGDYVVALEVGGRAFSTEALAKWLDQRRQQGGDVAFMIGGPDGLDASCRARADLQWSLSPLTLPHGLARVLVIEQLYRAASILANHPYHRA